MVSNADIQKKPKDVHCFCYHSTIFTLGQLPNSAAPKISLQSVGLAVFLLLEGFFKGKIQLMQEDELNLTILRLIKTALVTYNSLVNAWEGQGNVLLWCGLWL